MYDPAAVSQDTGVHAARNHLLVLATLIFLAGCFEPAPDSHRVVINGETMLIGEIERSELYRENPEFERDANAYLPDAEVIANLREITAETEIVVFLGTWCSDSQSEIPKFLKVIDELDNPNFDVTVYGLDRTKEDASGNALSHGIAFVPTIVLYRGGKELGRIVEIPEQSMETDLLRILRGHSE